MIRAAERIMGLVSQRRIVLDLVMRGNVITTLVIVATFQQVTLSICGSNNFDVKHLSFTRIFFFIFFVFVKQDTLIRAFCNN